MEEVNVERVSGAIEAAPADPEPLFSLLDEEVEWDYVGAFPEAKTYHGPTEVRDFFARWSGAFDDFDVEAEELRPIGESVVMLLRQSGRGRETGAEVESRTWQVLTFRDGRIIRCRGYATEDEALEAAAG